jgi:hypothetical protein
MLLPPHPLLDATSVGEDIGSYLGRVGEIFAAFRGHDSRCTSFGVRIGGGRWFVKFAEHPEAVEHLRSALRFHEAVRWAASRSRGLQTTAPAAASSSRRRRSTREPS